jgi:hypothetical protein
MKTISTINKVAGDYKPGDLVLITGAVGSGRTNYLFFEAVNAAINKNKVLFCSEEMPTGHVAKRMNQCIQSLCNSGDKEIYGMGIYSDKKQKKLDILIRQFVNYDKFTLRLNNFIKSLDKKDKKPDAIFIDSVRMSSSSCFNTQKKYIEFLKRNFEELKQIAVETQTVIFVCSQEQRAPNFNNKTEEFDKAKEETLSYFDFVFHVANKGIYEFSKANVFEISILRAKGKNKNVLLKGTFDFANVNLFFDFDCGYDNTLHDLSKQFQGLSFVVSPKGECGELFLLNLAEMYSKTGNNVLVISKLEHAADLNKMMGSDGKCLPDDDILTFDNNIGKMHFSINFPMSEDIITYIKLKKEQIKDLDYIIIEDVDSFCEGDSQQNTLFVQNLRKFAVSNDICLIASSYTIIGLRPNEIELTDFTRTLTKAAVSDFVLGLRMYYPTFLERIFKPKHNMIFSVLKNRNGEHGLKFYAKINKNSLGLKIIKTFLIKKRIK